MTNQHEMLDIIIPAYKKRFLPILLDSITKQTSKRFRVIVADDASPDDIKATCDKYSALYPLRYVRFEDNLGAVDLAGHWNRAVAISDAEWVLLPGDDDVLEPNCVSAFWETLIGSQKSPEVFSFGVRIVNEFNEVIRENKPAEVADSAEFLLQRFEGKLSPMPVGYIFSRKAFDRCGGFVSFDKGWHSDDASWARFCTLFGISPINDAFVRWRISSFNISPFMQKNAFRRTCASIEFVSWLIKSSEFLEMSDDQIRGVISKVDYWSWYSGISEAPLLSKWAFAAWHASLVLGKCTEVSFIRHIFRFSRCKFSRFLALLRNEWVMRRRTG